jgi:hypothetical protein
MPAGQRDISAENTKKYEQIVTDGIQLECDMNDIRHEVEAPLPSWVPGIPLYRLKDGNVRATHKLDGNSVRVLQVYS